MPLYVIRPDNPIAGQDWLAAVPGQYLYDITGITATLTTAGATDAPTDVSGNNLNGDYFTSSPPVRHFPGVLTGDDALDTAYSTNFSGVKGGWQNGGSQIPLTGDFTIVWWYYPSTLVPGPVHMVASDIGGNPVGGMVSRSDVGGVVDFGGPFPSVAATCFTPITAGVWHLIGVDYDAGTQHARLFLDGVELILDIDVAGPATSDVVELLDFGNSGGWSPDNTGGMDEFAYFDHQIGPVGHNALFGAIPDFAAYTAACLALTPRVYYHLDGALSPGGNRQANLAVTDGTTNVTEVPTGFPLTASHGPFFYSWQPSLRSSTQTQNGTNTAVAIPRLILPAGYTVGADTLGLSPADQWSDIAIWWDSTLMDTLNNPYEYPPGWHITFPDDPLLPIPPGIK